MSLLITEESYDCIPTNEGENSRLNIPGVPNDNASCLTNVSSPCYLSPSPDTFPNCKFQPVANESQALPMESSPFPTKTHTPPVPQKRSIGLDLGIDYVNSIGSRQGDIYTELQILVCGQIIKTRYLLMRVELM